MNTERNLFGPQVAHSLPMEKENNIVFIHFEDLRGKGEMYGLYQLCSYTWLNTIVLIIFNCNLCDFQNIYKEMDD